MTTNEKLLEKTREIMEFQVGGEILTDEVITYMDLMMNWAWLYEKYRDEVLEVAAEELEHGLTTLISRIQNDSKWGSSFEENGFSIGRQKDEE